VGAKGWDIGLSKTGYTNEAGRCLIMRITAAGKNATVVLLNASGSAARISDALNIRRFITGGDEPRIMKAKGKAMKASKGNGRKKAVTKKKPRRRRAAA
jgi:D-alanyl-D-alanine carboxypeptidase/D-alanyl-D-alanine endopeptidase (penicillin-binding protein 7)